MGIFDKLYEPFLDTVYLTFVPLLLSIFFGFIIGTVIFITSDNNIIEKNTKFLKALNRVSDFIVNFLRSVPYLIMLIWLLPVAQLLTGRVTGANAAIPSLVVSATPFFARMIVIAFTEVNKGTIEASKALGASLWDIIFKVLIPESKPAIISSITVTGINLVSYSAMAGAVGAGGLGFTAFTYGIARHNTQLMLASTLVIVVIVFIIQIIGDYYTKKTDKR